MGGPVVYLSTDPLKAACAVAPGASPNPVDTTGECGWPLDRLSAGGVFVEWIADRILQPMPTSGTRIQMASGATVLVTERPGPCAAVGADETITAAIPVGQPSSLSNMSIVACIRGPDLATKEAQVRALFESSIGP